jgi:hypothetical protein
MARRNLAFAALLLTAPGCSALPSYQLRISSPQKDVLHMAVYLPERADSSVYRRIALEELARIQSELQERRLPLYEVDFEFRRNDPEREKLARVVAHLVDDLVPPEGELVEAPAPRIETTLY